MNTLYIPPFVKAAFHCSAGSNRCQRAYDNCPGSCSDFSKHPRAIAADVVDAGTRSPCWPPGRRMRICETCLAPGKATAALSSVAAICRSDPLDRQSHRSHPHLQLAQFRAPSLPSATVWAWLWGTVCRLCRA